jgi:hypothetical protein
MVQHMGVAVELYFDEGSERQLRQLQAQLNKMVLPAPAEATFTVAHQLARFIRADGIYRQA